MDKEKERSLLGMDEEIHRLLQYISRSKEKDVDAKLEDYENLKRKIIQQSERAVGSY